MKVRKAVFPVAGFGTRMLPATKAIPKEMITLIDKPLIQYAVEEAVEAGIEQIIFVTGRTKKSLEDHFDKSVELDLSLKSAGKDDLSLEMDRISNLCDVVTVRQKEQKGLGHAIACASEIIGDEPFAVMLPDDVMMYQSSVIGQMIQQYEKTGSSVVALKQVPMAETHRYGIVSVKEDCGGGLYHLSDMVEKPSENSPSDLAIIGRYILTPDVLDELFKIQPGAQGELQLTDAIRAVTQNSAVYGYTYEGTRFDCGNKAGYLEAIVNFAMQRNDTKDDMIRIMKAALDH